MVLGAASVPSRALAGAANLAPNGGIEIADADDPNRPAGWTPHVHGRVSVAWSTHGPHSGRRCLEMSADAADRWGHAYWTSAPIPVKPCIAYRVRFHYRARGHGVPCFSLSKVKSWRLFKGDTEGTWLAHEDVVVVPPDVTETRFSVNNYHRPGKTMWLDDLSIVELPLSASPLTKRLARARRGVAAVGRSCARLRLTSVQQAELRAMREALGDVEAGYAKLAEGSARPADFGRIHSGLDAIENAVGGYLFTVWPIGSPPRGGAVAGPTTASRNCELTLVPSPEGTFACCIGVMGLIGEGLPMRVTLAADRKARNWPARLLLAPAHRPGQWGEMNPLGTLYVPTSAPRLLRVEIVRDPQATAGTYTFHLTLTGVNRATQPGQVTIRAVVSDN